MMHVVSKVVLSRARDDVRGLLRDMILSGELAGGARIEEVELAERMGVSRTPVREALIALERDGLVRSRPHRGFVVEAADAGLVREAYPILSALEAAAVRLSWPALKAAASELSDINNQLAAAKGRIEQYRLDRAFHARLTADCGNPRLLALLDVERTRAQRFDGAEARGTADHAGSCREHAAIVAAVRKGDLDGVLRQLAAHWERGVEVVVGWLEQP